MIKKGGPYRSTARTSAQRAAIAIEILPELEAEAKERQIRKPADSVTQKIGEQKKHTTEASEQAAQLLNTNRQYVSDLKKIKEQAPAGVDPRGNR